MCQSCANNYQKIARKLLRELEAQCLEVVLIPADEQKHSGHCIRVVQEQNPPWYQDFCGMYETRGKKRYTRRKFQTRIKRAWTIKALHAMAEGRVETIYADRLLEFIGRRQHQQQRRAA